MLLNQRLVPLMPAYDIAASDRFGPGNNMPGIDLADPGWTIAIHDRPLLKAHKHLPRRRDPTLPSIDLRSHYKKTQVRLPKGNVHKSCGTSTTPPNPPKTSPLEPSPSPIIVREPSDHGRDDSSNAETTILRSRVATPTYPKSPPTPDRTPPHPEHLLKPRLLLANALSVSSRAESFKTAREELSSDDDDITNESPSQRSSHQRWPQNNQSARLEDWRGKPSLVVQTGETVVTSTKIIKRKPLPGEEFATFDGTWDAEEEEETVTPTKLTSALNDTVRGVEVGEPLPPIASPPSTLPTPPRSADVNEQPSATQPPQRGQSLRDRLKESNTIRASDSIEKFAQDIGWSHVYRSPDFQNRINSWRLSGISTTSTVEVIVVDADAAPQRQQQLRHSRGNPSLRSASSPFPASKRYSLLSNPDSPHRLVHKKGKITNKNRWSMGSEASRAEVTRTNRVSLAMSDPTTPEIIHVAVIPERKSSLPSSENSSRRHSVSLSLSSAGRLQRFAPDHPIAETHVPLRKKRAMSASVPVGTSFDGRGRNRKPSQDVPARASSLSAPTSQSNSRANSLTSEHLRLRRLAAEEDLHRTLERMESERSVVPRYGASDARQSSSTHPAESESENWDTLSPPYQPTLFSMESPSPGPVEMGKARAVNLFAHNNHSLQIVDQYPQAESRAVLSLQKGGGITGLVVDEPTTPTRTVLPQLLIDSPLRNPRDPPQPPALKVIPPTPADLTPIENDNRQLGLPSPDTRLGKTGIISRRFASLRRPSLGNRHHSESFVKSISRTLSLRGARNMKIDQDLDANLHPFWRPRGFWDDISDSDSDRDGYEEDMVVSNSLGVPQTRSVIDGPISLVRHLSDSSRRYRRNAGVRRRSSHGSLSSFRIGRKPYKISGSGRQFPFLRLRDIQNRLQLSSRRKEDEKRERNRQALREKIGPQIISTGDSRYPAYLPAVPPSTGGQRVPTDGRAGFSS